MNAPTTIRVERLLVRAGQRRLLDDVTFALPAGSMTVLLGPNGSGKTSLLRAIAGILPREHGDIYFGDVPVQKLRRAEVARLCAYLPQQTTAKFAMRVEDVVALGRYPHRHGWAGLTTEDYDRIRWALERVGLAGMRERSITTLSGGELQRTFVARALAQESPVLLLDEPISSLDVGRTLELMNLLANLNCEGRTVLAALHDLRPALEFFPRALLLNAGRLVDDDATEKVLFGSATSTAYGVIVERREDIAFRSKE